MENYSGDGAAGGGGEGEGLREGLREGVREGSREGSNRRGGETEIVNCFDGELSKPLKR